MRRANIVLTALAVLYLSLIYGKLRPEFGLLKPPIETYHIAVVTAPSNPDVGYAVQLQLEEFNRHAAELGRRLVVDAYQDNGQPTEARRIAKAIAASEAVAVIGHPDSTSSLVAGEIYQEEHIPAISVQATNYAVTRSNPWYFRTVFNDRDQGLYLANYIRHILKADTLYIIHSGDPYGEYLATTVSEVLKGDGVEIIGSERLVRGEYLSPEELVEPLVEHQKDEAQALAEAQRRYEHAYERHPDDPELEEPVAKRPVIFLAVASDEGIPVITALRDAGLDYPIVGTESLSDQQLVNELCHHPLELAQPGYYTQNLYLSTPFSFELANREAQQFKHRFAAEYNHQPNWQAMYAYDASKLIAQAVDRFHAKRGTLPSSVAEQRQQVRQYLLGLNSPQKAISGVTGDNWFDGGGDVNHPITLLHFQRGQINVAPLQIYPEVDPFGREDRDSRWLTNSLLVDHQVVRIRKVVYTSISIDKIDQIDMKALTFEMSFDLWFRGTDAITQDDIELLNAASEVKLGYPVSDRIIGDIHYTLFHTKGRFKADFHPLDYRYGSHIVGLQFQHTKSDARQLDFVIDYRGMGLQGEQKGRPVLERMVQERVVASESGWLQSDLYIYRDLAGRPSLGEPERINPEGGYLDHSRFNIEVVVISDGLVIYNLLDEQQATQLVIILLGCVLLVLWLLINIRQGPLNQLLWVWQTLQIVCLILALQVVVINEANGLLLPYQVRVLSVAFEVLWWLFAALTLDLLVRRFVWSTLEESTDQTVPVLVKNFITFVIFSVALLGIVAFVYEQKVTSLLATSGVLAMIIGLAIQMNIANIFSGIALNLEAPFRPGDWVRIGDYPEARVYDITWRATRLITRDEHLLCVPNHLAAESTVHNYTQPDQGASQQLEVQIPANADPLRVRKVLLDALLSTREVTLTPPPKVLIVGITGHLGIEQDNTCYRLRFHLHDYHARSAALDSVWERVWIHLRRSEIMSPVNAGNPLLEDGIRTQEEALLDAFNQMDLFATLPPEERERMARELQPTCYHRNEVIVEVGQPSDSMYLIVEGAVQVQVPDADGRVHDVRRLGVGDYFGEIGLRNHSPRTATITALSDSLLVELPRALVLPMLDKIPEMPDLFEAIVKQRAQEAQEVAKSREEQETPRPLLVRLLITLFGLGKIKIKRKRGPA